jgi:hypothetical protein
MLTQMASRWEQAKADREFALASTGLEYTVVLSAVNSVAEASELRQGNGWAFSTQFVLFT